MVNRIVVGAHYGLRDWLAQRVTAVVMAVYALFLAIVLLMQPTLDHAAWKAIFANGFMRFATLLALLSLFWHAWIGMRDIWMDYVKPTGTRLVLQVATILALVAYVAWTVQILWGL